MSFEIPLVGQVMTTTLQIINHDASIEAAEALMREHAVRHLPVRYGLRFLGVITERDLLVARVPKSDDVPLLTVGDICNKECYMVSAETPLDEVVTHMARNHIDSTLINDGDQLAGILTSIDVCRLYGDFLRSAMLKAA